MSREVIKPVVIKDNDSKAEYELDFSRDTVRFANARGFKLDELSDFPTTVVPELFWLAFRKNHKNVSREKTDALIERLGGLPKPLIARLIDLYTQAGLTGIVLSDDDEVDEKNGSIAIVM